MHAPRDSVSLATTHLFLCIYCVSSRYHEMVFAIRMKSVTAQEFMPVLYLLRASLVLSLTFANDKQVY